MDSTNHSDLRLITVDPAISTQPQKQQLPGVASRPRIRPAGADLLAHPDRVSRFNARTETPTNWKLRVYAGEDFRKDDRGSAWERRCSPAAMQRNLFIEAAVGRGSTCLPISRSSWNAQHRSSRRFDRPPP